MIPSIAVAYRILSKMWFLISFINVLAAAVFYPLMCLNNPKEVQASNLILITIIAAGVGFVPGIYLTYRSRFALRYALSIPPYYTVMLEIIFFGSGTAFVAILAGRPDLRWLAFNINALCMVLSLLVSMYLEAKEVGFWKNTKQWREEIEKFIDYSKRELRPSLTDTYKPRIKFKHPILIAMVGAANIPLLFDIYGGGKANAIFLAAPVGMMATAYFNFKAIGPALTRLLLLRKIEKEVGYRFQNADYEEIQELRRGFFLAPWLMKDYRPPQTQSLKAEETKQQAIKRQKHKRRG